MLLAVGDFVTALLEQGFINTMLIPYYDAMGGVDVFWISVAFVVIGLAYSQSNDVFYPMVFLIAGGSVLGSVVGVLGFKIGWGILVIGITAMFIRLLFGYLNRG